MLVNYDVKRVLDNGEYFVIDEFPQKNIRYDFVKNIIFEGIQQIQGLQYRETIEEVGLSKLHKHFSVDNLWHLEKFVENKVREEVLKMTYEVGKDILGLDEEFFIDHNINIRINYPFAVARQAKLTYEDYVHKTSSYSQGYSSELSSKSIKDESSSNTSNLNVLGRVKNALKAISYNSQETNQDRTRKYLGTSQQVKIEGKAKYFKNLPYTASAKFAHGPHLDTWFGHSYDGINLWWAIDGVSEDNGIILYPEMFEQHLEHLKEPPYVSPGTSLPKPCKIAPKAGSMLIFNPEVLHGTQLNVSELTRIVISTRLNPAKPLFDPNIVNYHMKFWYSSKDLATNSFGNVLEFSKEDNLGNSRIKNIDDSPPNQPTVITIDDQKLGEIPIEICNSEGLILGQKILVKFKNEDVVIINNTRGIFAFRSACPHVGINLVDGFYDEKDIYCPGHGVAFDIKDGSSKCDLLKLQVYEAYEKDSKIFLKK